MTDGDAVTTTYGYDAEGQPTTTARTVPLASGTATQVTTQDQDVVSDVILHGVSLGISRRSTQTVSSTGVAPVTVAESFVSRDGLSRGTRSLNGSTRTVTTRPDAAGVATTTTTRENGVSGVRVQILTKSAAFLTFQHATKPAS